ncbi:MAG TPA: hypothetical protein VNW52_07810 [Burkholderiaceae bacterium]|jgi:hypothetical protein|nr:hypothetical protein [Burkholderiaceae bacterium]
MATDLDLAITISADAEGLSSGMADAQAAIESGAAGISQASAAMADGVKASTDGIGAAFQHMSSTLKESASKGGAALVELGTQAKERAEGIESALSGIGKVMNTVGEAMHGGAIGEALISLAEKTGEFGESIERAAAKTSMGVEKIQALRFAASMSGVSADSMTNAMGSLSVKIAEAGDKASPTAAAFKAVGLSAQDLKSMSPEDVLKRVADKFHNADDSAQKTTVAMLLFGSAGENMIPMLNKGAAGIEELMARAAELGIVLDKEAVAKTIELSEKMKELKAVHDAAAVQIGAALTPAFLSIATAFETNLKTGGAFKTFVDGLGPALIVLAKAGSFVAEAFDVLGNMIGAQLAADMAIAHGNFADAAHILVDLAQHVAEADVSYTKFRDDLGKPVDIPKPKEDGGGVAAKVAKDNIVLNLAHQAKKESMMHAFAEQLAVSKEGFEKEQLAQGSFVEWSKQKDLEFWQGKAKTAGLGAADLLSINIKMSADERAIMKEGFAAKLAGFEAEITAQGKNSQAKIAIVQKEADAIAKAFGKESAQAIEAIKKVADMQRQADVDARKIVDEKQKIVDAHAEAEVAKEKEVFEFKKTQGLLTNEEILAQEQKFENDSFNIKQKSLQKQKTLINPDMDPVAYQAILTQIETLKVAHDAKMQALAATNALQAKTAYTTAYAAIQSGMASSITSMVQGTKSFQQAAKSMLASVLNSVIEYYAGEMAKEAVKQAKIMFGFGQQTAGSEATSTAQATDATAVGAANEAAAELSVQAWAGVAGAAGVASFAAAPWPVDVGAPAFGAAMYASAAAFSAEGGFDIPAGVNPVTQLHEKEMVLPAKQADAVRDMANGKGGSGGNVNLHVHAMDAQSVKRLFENNGTALMDVIRKQRRNFTQ